MPHVCQKWHPCMTRTRGATHCLQESCFDHPPLPPPFYHCSHAASHTLFCFVSVFAAAHRSPQSAHNPVGSPQYCAFCAMDDGNTIPGHLTMYLHVRTPYLPQNILTSSLNYTPPVAFELNFWITSNKLHTCCPPRWYELCVTKCQLVLYYETTSPTAGPTLVVHVQLHLTSAFATPFPIATCSPPLMLHLKQSTRQVSMTCGAHAYTLSKRRKLFAIDPLLRISMRRQVPSEKMPLISSF